MLLLTLLFLCSDPADKWTQLIDSRLTRNSAQLSESFWDDARRSDLAMQEYLLTLGQNGDPRYAELVAGFFQHHLLQASALFAYGEIDGAPIEPLLQARDKVKPSSLPYLIEACTKLAGDEHKATVAQLWSQLDGEARKQSTHFFHQVATPELNEQITKALTQSQSPDLHGGVYYLFRGRAQIKPAQLNHILKVYRPYSQTLIHGLRIRVSEASPELVQTVEELSLHRDWRVRVNALNALMNLAPEAGSARAKTLLTVDDNANVIKTALTALIRQNNQDEDRGLRELGRKLSPGHQKAMVVAAGDDPLRFFDLIVAWAKSEDRWQRQSALGFWGQIAGDDVLGELNRMVTSAEPVTAAIALSQLGKTESDTIDGHIATALDSKDPFMLGAIIPYLSKHKLAYQQHKAKLEQRLAETYPESDFHFAYINNLEALVGKDNIEAALAPLRKHPDYLVRLKAFQASPKSSAVKHEDVFNGGWTRTVPAKVRERAISYAANRKSPSWILKTSKGEITIKLEAGYAPITCANIVTLSEQDYFNDMPIHRVVPNFVVQAGDSRGDGSGGPGYAIPCEVNMLRYRRGAVGMALSGKDTGGSQFFLCHSDQPHLDGGYTVFGSVSAGMEVVDQLEEGDRILSSRIAH